MFSTSITRTFGLTTPIVNAGMAMIARPALAAAVCEAGGLGTIGSDINPPDILRDLVRQTKAPTKRSFGVDLIGDFVTDEHLQSSSRNRWRSPSSSGRCRRQSMLNG
jgi:NAD(P)H-dependent flavin oxidoreductase YrpB (nitropropane dioxygenase family)